MFHKLAKCFPPDALKWSSVEEEGKTLRVCELPGNLTKYYLEGELGKERHVRTEFPSGCVQWYEGEREAERCVKKWAVVPGEFVDMTPQV
jgi:hypothetical protein